MKPDVTKKDLEMANRTILLNESKKQDWTQVEETKLEIFTLEKKVYHSLLHIIS